MKCVCVRALGCSCVSLPQTGWFMLSPLPQSTVAYRHSQPAICSLDQICLFLAISVLTERAEVIFFLSLLYFYWVIKHSVDFLLKERAGSKGSHWQFFGLTKNVLISVLCSSKNCPRICFKADRLMFFTRPFLCHLFFFLFEQVCACSKLLARV